MRTMGIKILPVWLGGLFFWLALSAHSQQTHQDFEQGKKNYHDKNWDGAITNFSKSIEAGYNLYDSYNYRAYSLAMQGSSNAAIADCNRVVKLQPSYSGGYYWRSRVKLALTNFDGALADFEIGLKLYSKDRPEDLAQDLAHTLTAFSQKKIMCGDLKGGITNLTQAIKICPTNWSAYLTRGYWKLLDGGSSAAIADAYVAIKHFPDQAFSYEIRAWARCELNDVSGATEDCRQALKIIDKSRPKESDVNKFAEWEMESSLMTGLQAYINDDFAGAVNRWSIFVNEAEKNLVPNKKIPLVAEKYFQKWLDKAQEKLNVQKH